MTPKQEPYYTPQQVKRWITEELRDIKEKRLCSVHNASRHYYRGYREALRNVRDLLNEKKEVPDDHQQEARHQSRAVEEISKTKGGC